MYELLGPHVNQTYGGLPELVAQWKPPVALILDHAPAWTWVKEQSPKTIMIGRWNHGNPPNFENIDPVQHARNQLAPILGAIAASPYDYIVGDNEVVVGSPKAMKNLALYDMERIRILKKVGKKAAICGLATGNPSNMSWLKEYLPAIELAAKEGAVLYLHQYDWPTIGSNGVWLPYRHELFYEGCPEHGWAGLPERLRIPLIITEFGLDEGAVRPGRLHGWRSAGITIEQYNAQLQEGNARLMFKPYVLGACIFCTGNASQDWVMFDFWPEVQLLAKNASPVYRTYKVSPTKEKDRPIVGVDISQWQRTFPFVKAKEVDGVSFAILRSSVGLCHDPKFLQHLAPARDHMHGLGIYHFLNPGNVAEQARLFASIAVDSPMNLGCFLDVEHRGTNRAMVEEFKRVFENKSGLPLDYYSSGYLWGKIVGRSKLLESRGFKWVADWRNIERFNVPRGFSRAGVKIRQITSKNGYVSSFRGNLDINKWVGDPNEFWSLS